MKYDFRKIMLRAWKLYKTNKGLSFAECLHRAWLSEKALEINHKRIEDAKTAAGVTEEVRTWSDWKKVGREVLHGMKAVFRVVLIWGSKGDGAFYNASFFTESQTQPVLE